ncbi:hypothetical protein DBIPINDM_001379 [Mesorhizobium sp. AR02]|uniref:hypothetical protein n=1 Tax=Mesorhizobium sp. AR02 TaxID=2865837 RepID=UPI00215E48EC|nr:hypothetical protein [Mesorhizobium sp. AR02]UVK54903.1 hypothetical protein DBIPINDM_001379 [Mesorhizobium sp. AR02]
MPENKEKAQKRFNDLIVARTLIHPDYLGKEAKLMTTKWFNYRFLSPLEATMLFGDMYVRALRGYVRQHIERDLAQKVRGIKSGIPKQRARWFTQLWAARQRADEFPIPYDLQLAFAFDFAAGRKRRWSMLPNQVHASENNNEAWWATFHSFVENHLPTYMHRLNELPQYRLEHDRGLAAQHEFREIMAAELNVSSKSWVDWIGEMVVARRHLCVRDAMELVPSDCRTEVRDSVRNDYLRARWTPAPREPLDDEDFSLSCFGVQESIDRNSDPCASCPLVQKCMVVAAGTVDAVILNTGSSSPVVNADQERNRRNVAAFRARQKLKSRRPSLSDHSSFCPEESCKPGASL